MDAFHESPWAVLTFHQINLNSKLNLIKLINYIIYLQTFHKL